MPANAAPTQLRVLISAAEASSDAHGAELLGALREIARERGAEIEAFGIGGTHLRSQGLDVLIGAETLLAMGFSEILGRLPRIFRALRELARAAGERKPGVAIVIDYPDFHFRLARRLRRHGIPCVYYIPPKVWVWRKGRVKLLRELFARVLCIFPFETEIYAKARVNARYVGNPLLDELPFDLTREEARKRLGISADDRVLLLMPGSRPSELKRHIPLMTGAALALRAQLPKLRILMALPMGTAAEGVPDGIEVSRGRAHECQLAADAGLIKSGTSTLEAALLGLPHAVVFRPSASTQWIFQNLIRYRGPVGLVNLVRGWKTGDPYLARELLCQEATPENLSREALELLTDPARAARMRDDFRVLRESLRREKSPSREAAEAIWEVLSP